MTLQGRGHLTGVLKDKQEFSGKQSNIAKAQGQERAW